MRILFSLFLLSCGLAFAQSIELCQAAIEQGFYSTPNGFVFNDYDLKESFALEEHSELLPYIAALGKAFEANSIVPVTALVPTRPMVYAEEMGTTAFNTAKSWQSYQYFRNTFNQRGFLTPDLLFSFRTAESEGEKVFFKLDHHWAPEGAQIAAEEVRKALNFLSSYQSLETTAYTAIAVKEESYRGSRIAEVDTICGTVDVADESYTRYTTQAEEAPAATNLFGDIKRPDVVYVGTSNGEENLNFSGRLKETLGLNVLKANLVGGAAFTAIQNFIYSDDYQLDGYRPPFMVWEVNINTTSIISDEILDFSDPLSYRQLIPSLYGQCENQSLLSSQGQTQLELSNDINLGIAGSNYYLFVEADNNTLNEINVLVNYETGERETLRLLRPERLESPNRYFLEFSDFFEGNIKTVTVTTADPSVNLNAQVCNTGSSMPRVYDFQEADLLASIAAPGLDVIGFDMPETENRSSWRWAFGEQSELKFITEGAKPIKLELRLSSPIEEQAIDIVFNDQVLANLSQLGSGSSKELVLDAQAGLNRLELRFADWNTGKTTFEPNDTRPLSAVFSKLSLSPTQEAVTVVEDLQAAVEVSATETSIRQVTPNAGGTAPISPIEGLDVARIAEPDSVVLDGFSRVEGQSGRWALGPESKLSFELEQDASLSIDMAIFNPIDQQSIEVLFNGTTIDSFETLADQVFLEKAYTLDASAGENSLSFVYSDWNGKDTVFSEGDSRPMSIFFSKLQLSDDKNALLASTLSEPIMPIEPTELVTVVETVPEAPLALTQNIQSLPVVDLAEGNLITNLADTLVLDGFSEAENNNLRWALGPQTNIDFKSDKAQALEVEMAFFNPIQGQSLEVMFNGAIVQNLSQLHQGTEMNLKFFVNAIPGVNRLSINYSDWNGNQSNFAPADPRPMAVLFSQLELRSRQ